MTKIVSINCSGKKKGNSYILAKTVLNGVREVDPEIHIKLIELADYRIDPCNGCYVCEKEPNECVIDSDDFKKFLAELSHADGIVFACPMYIPIPAKLVAFVERMVQPSYFSTITNVNRFPLEGKLFGMCCVSHMRGAYIQVLQQLLWHGMRLKMQPVTIQSYPFIGVAAEGWKAGDVQRDKKALDQARELGRLIAEAARAYSPGSRGSQR